MLVFRCGVLARACEAPRSVGPARSGALTVPHHRLYISIVLVALSRLVAPSSDATRFTVVPLSPRFSSLFALYLPVSRDRSRSERSAARLNAKWALIGGP